MNEFIYGLFFAATFTVALMFVKWFNKNDDDENNSGAAPALFSKQLATG